MSTSFLQDQDFCNEVADHMELEVRGDASWVIDWVARQFEPGEVYADQALAEWARANGFIHMSEVSGEDVT